MTEYNAGDTVTLEHADGSRMVDRKIFLSGGSKCVKTVNGESAVLGLLSEWKVTSHNPKVELPTEPGYYQVVDASGYGAYDVIELLNSPRQWAKADDSQYLDDDDMARFSNFVLLRPVAETAAEVLDAIDDGMERRDWSTITEDVNAVWDAVREHFGVEV
jgi:hypothetical protein